MRRGRVKHHREMSDEAMKLHHAWRVIRLMHAVDEHGALCAELNT